MWVWGGCGRGCGCGVGVSVGSGHGRWYEHRYKCGVGVCVGVVGNNRVGVLRQLSHGQLSCFCLRAKNVCGVYGRAPLFDQRMEGRPC